MVDPGSLLDTLRPLRMPPAPGPVWPVLVMALAGFGLVPLAVWAVALVQARRRGVRRGAEAELALSRGLPLAQRLTAQAVLLRRLVRTTSGAHDPDLVGVVGSAWLERLDRTFATTFFSRGEGQAFGPALYRAGNPVDVEALDRSLAALIAKVRR